MELFLFLLLLLLLLQLHLWSSALGGKKMPKLPKTTGHALFGQGFNGEDVLVLEYCDGSTLYDLYAREHPKARVFQGEAIPLLSSWWSPKCWGFTEIKRRSFQLGPTKT